MPICIWKCMFTRHLNIDTQWPLSTLLLTIMQILILVTKEMTSGFSINILMPAGLFWNIFVFALGWPVSRNFLICKVIRGADKKKHRKVQRFSWQPFRPNLARQLLQSLSRIGTQRSQVHIECPISGAIGSHSFDWFASQVGGEQDAGKPEPVASECR